MNCTEERYVCGIRGIGDVVKVAEAVVAAGVGDGEEDRAFGREETGDLSYRAFSRCSGRRCQPQKWKSKDAFEKHLEKLEHELKGKVEEEGNVLSFVKILTEGGGTPRGE